MNKQGRQWGRGDEQQARKWSCHLPRTCGLEMSHLASKALIIRTTPAHNTAEAHVNILLYKKY